MKKINEESALALLFSNTKRKKRKTDLITLAKTSEYLINLYGSKKVLAEKLGLSTEMIREFLIALKLPKYIQKSISNREIDSIDTIREISTIKDKNKQILAAKLLINSYSKDVRDIKRLIKNSNITVENAKEVILGEKPKGMHIFVLDFDDEIYDFIKVQSKNMKIDPAELVRNIVKNWIVKKRKKAK